MTDPSPLPDFAPSCLVDLDLRAGGELVAAMRRALDRLPPGRVLHLRLGAAPDTLLAALGDPALRTRSARYADDDWSLWCWRGDPPIADAALPAEDRPTDDDALDLRGLAPPQPLLAILARVEADADDFDALLPFYPSPLPELLRPWRRRLVLLADTPYGVRVRIEREEPSA